MNSKQLETAFGRLNELLRAKGIRGEICVVGGAAMVLAFNAREATKDVDAIFSPSQEIRDAARKVAAELKLPPDWLNDGVKAFLPGNPPSQQTVLDLDSLQVWVPPAEYLLAMKATSARFDSHDADDVRTLCKHLKIKTASRALKIVSKYYPHERIPPKTAFFLEELLEEQD